MRSSVRPLTLPSRATVTVEVPSVVVTARTGTWIASSTTAVSMAPLIVVPTANEVSSVSKAMDTGYCATPDDASATRPTSVTLPVTDVPVAPFTEVPFPLSFVLPAPAPPLPAPPLPMGKPPPGKNPPAPEALVDRVTVTTAPTSMLSTLLESTSSSDVYRPVLTTWMSGEEPLELFELSDPRPPSPDEPVPSVDDDCPVPVLDPVCDDPPEPPEPSCSPTETFTAATVPSKVATSVAPASASCASASASAAVWTREV